MMDIETSKRRGRREKFTTDVTGTQENDAGSFDQLVAKVKEASRSWKTNVCIAQHPEPAQDWIPTLTGWVRVIKGPAGYHLNNGEFVSL